MSLCLEVTSIQMITSKRNVGSYMISDWTHYFIRWSTLNLTRWYPFPRHGDGFPFPANPYNRCLAEAALSYLPEGVISIPDAAAWPSIQGYKWYRWGRLYVNRNPNGEAVRHELSSRRSVDRYDRKSGAQAVSIILILGIICHLLDLVLH